MRMKGVIFIIISFLALSHFSVFAQVEREEDAYELVTTHKNLVKLAYRDIGSFLDAHNEWRDKVNAPELEWNDYLAKYSADWVIKLAEDGCNLSHRPDNRFGENIFMTSAPTFTPEEVVGFWAEGRKDYKGDVISGDISKTGHYTQIVWYETKEVGCAAFNCVNGTLVVCNYNPTGNIIDTHPYKRKKKKK